MEMISRFVFLPLTICLLVITFNEKLRRRVIAMKGIAALENRLGGLERLYWLAFALIMAAGVFTRCYRFLELPMGVNQDGTLAAAEAYCLAMDGTDQYGRSWPTYFEAWKFSQMSTLYSCLMIPFIKVLGLSKLTLRLPMLLVSLAMLPLIWDFARRIAGKVFALCVLLIAATSPWQILQSRWALEANLMPHVLLTGMYLLYLGREKRWALYLSMVFFALTPYAYGVACFVTPVILVCAAAFYLARRKANVPDVIVCVLIFAGIAGPYFYTMLINALGLETAQMGPITMPFFEKSLRSNDMAFTQDNPYFQMLWNLLPHLGTWLCLGTPAPYSALPWTHSVYLFMPPVFLVGIYSMWSKRRALALRGEECPLRDGGMLLLIWLGAAMFCGLMIGGVINRNNAVFYPLMMLGGWTLYQMGKRLRTALALVVAMLVVSFGGLNVTYFTDEAYQKTVGDSFHQGLYQALVDTWGWDYDRYYVLCLDDNAHKTFMTGSVMFAHQIDYSERNEDRELDGPDGEPTGWYFTERYIFTDYRDFEPDPMECAVYIIAQDQKNLFDPQDYLIKDYGIFATVYPRYWAE